MMNIWRASEGSKEAYKTMIDDLKKGGGCIRQLYLIVYQVTKW